MRRSYRNHSLERMHQITSKSLRLSDRFRSIVSLKVDLKEIRDILESNIKKSATGRYAKRKSNSAVTTYLRMNENKSFCKRVDSPVIYRAFKVRCHSPLLRMKLIRPKNSVSSNSFIVKGLSRP